MKKRITMSVVIAFMLALSLVICGCADTSAPASEATEATEAETAAEPATDVAAEPEAEAAAETDEALTIAYVPKTLSNEFYVAIQDQLQIECDARGWELLTNAGNSESDVDAQISILEAYIEADVDAIVLAATDQSAIGATIDNAAAAGIPVFEVDSGTDNGDYTALYATDNYEAGHKAGVLISEQIGGKGQVAILDTYSGCIPTQGRIAGFTDYINENYPDIEVVTTDFSNADASQSMQVTENWLAAYPDLAAIFATCDPAAVGSGQAVSAANLSDQIYICGVDGNPMAAQAIIDGTIDATIAQSPCSMATMAAENIEAYFNGDDYLKEADTGSTTVTIENAEDFLIWQ